jgi:predicted AlkP superfamily phosphohydrolase/phosphomutase
MKILILGLDCAAPELLLGDPRLVHFRRLMAQGCYGRLESVIPPITVPAWMCLATSQDPGSLGVYGFRNRADHSYTGLKTVDSSSFQAPALWDVVAQQGKRAHVIGVPPNYPPRMTSGVSVGCFLTPDNPAQPWTHPAEVQDEIRRVAGEYQVDVRGFRTENKAWLRDHILAMSRQHFAVVRHYLAQRDWDLLQCVEIGLDRMHHGFWKYHDPLHVGHVPGNPFQETIRDYYLELDTELGRILELLDEETVILVCSDHGAQRLDGGFCVNQWLVNEGLLVLNEMPREPTPFHKLSVDWSRTKVWSEGGYYARVFINLRGREPQGTVEQGDYERFRDELREKFANTVDPDGKPLGTLVFKPEEIYREVRNVAPDLIVHFGGLLWRSVGGVGHPTVHVRENDTGPDECNHAQFGAFILAAPNLQVRGQVEGAHLLDIAPSVLQLAGYEVPRSMQGNLLH